ncbi:uncharacterized protein SYNPCC7002_A0175-like [Lepeophtheirus salmonis]|uniref:uncharacterized protein SYNPCC7002_A0175-like n=1 Tax=Lepeophtheirus salmonis TaxID=72036 RepID=UPI001AE333F5|nr:uncharacterized protein SYNPCC7002_A0175-like [Lepeophtheirus salmonis]
MKSYIPLLLLASILSSRVEACGGKCKKDCNIVNVLANYKGFTGLVAAVQAAGLVDTLKSEGPFTVFAPADREFKKLPLTALIAIVSDETVLKDLLLRHVIPGQKILAQDIPEGTTTLPSASPSESITIVNQGGKITVSTSAGTASVYHPNVDAENGVIHTINGFL